MKVGTPPFLQRINETKLNKSPISKNRMLVNLLSKVSLHLIACSLAINLLQEISI
jgi:hypothetical protein